MSLIIIRVNNCKNDYFIETRNDSRNLINDILTCSIATIIIVVNIVGCILFLKKKMVTNHTLFIYRFFNMFHIITLQFYFIKGIEEKISRR